MLLIEEFFFLQFVCDIDFGQKGDVKRY